MNRWVTELLKLFALIADVNNETVKREADNNKFLDDILEDVYRFTRSKEVQQMAKCEFCEKGVTFGIQVSHSHRRSNRTWKPNVKRVKAIVDGSPRHVYVCTRCLRSGKVTRAV